MCTELLNAACEAVNAVREAGIHQHPDGGLLPWYERLLRAIAAETLRETADVV